MQKNILKIFEDDKVVAMLELNPVAKGHIIVMPKEHYPIIEQVPDYIIDHLFRIVNKISIVLFEALKAQGTNILINNGIAAGQDTAHFSVNIIPRMQNDGINIQWNPKQLSEEEISTIELELKNQASAIGEFEKEKDVPLKIQEAETIPEDEENYMIKQLRRIP